ncbi:MAG: GbsR/MarR family transcriptional regulator [Rubricoccaceae bacterium]
MPDHLALPPDAATGGSVPGGTASGDHAPGDYAPGGSSPPAEQPPAEPRSARHEAALAEFIDLWGEMATYWGINRTMAQIHALLFATETPLDTDAIMDRLGISRGNANMNLRALVEWSLVRKINLAGSRKDFFEAEKDVWTITTTIIEERQKRELKPVQEALGGVAAALREGAPLTPEEAVFAGRIESLVSFMETFDGFTSALLPFLRGRNADKVQRIIHFAAQLRAARTPSSNG